MNNPTNPDKALDLICPCGYKQKIPSKFDGQKVMCPKCQKVLRIQRVARVAKLLAHCPFCKSSTEYHPSVESCGKCKREFLFPEFVSQLGALPVSANQPTVAVGPTIETNEGPGISVATGAARPKKKKTRVNWISHLVGLVLAGAVLLVVWDNYGERLGLPPMPDFRNSGKNQGRPTALTGNSTGTRKTGTIEAKLASPSIKLHGISYEVFQALDRETSEVAGPMLRMEIDMENISDCVISSLTFAVQLSDQKRTKPSTKHFIKFKDPFLPHTQKIVTEDFPVIDLTKAKVSVVRVDAGEQTDTTLVELAVEFEN